MELGQPDVEVANEVLSPCHHERRKTLSTDQAISKLIKHLIDQGVRDPLQPIAPGIAQFLISYSKGKNRPLMSHYDTGSSKILFRDGVPQHKL